MSRQRVDQEAIRFAEQQVEARIKAFDTGVSLEKLLGLLETMQVDSVDAALQIYFLVLRMMQEERFRVALKQQQKFKLKDIAEKCLRYCQILPVTSQHSFLYGRLYQAFSWDKASAQLYWDSVVTRMVGEYLSRDAREQSPGNELLSGYQSWMLGHLRLAKVSLHSLQLEGDPSYADTKDALRLLVRIHRIADETSAARDLLSVLGAYPQVSAQERAELGLEALLCEMRSAQGPAQVLEFLKQEGKKLPLFLHQLAHLWLYASKLKFTPTAPKKGVLLPPLSHGSSYGLDLRAPQELLECLSTLHEPEVALNVRFDRLGKALVQAEQIEPELRIVFIAAALRWLNRSKQISFGAILLEEYRGLSLRYSEGRSVDTLGLTGDIQESLPLVSHKSVSRTEAKLYTGFTPRFLKMSLLISRAIARLSLYSLRHPLDAEARREVRRAVAIEILQDLEVLLGEMKGPLMKLCQTLAAFRLLDDNSQQIFREIFYSAPAVPFEELKPVLEEDLGADVWQRIFSFFQIEPLAVASLGEVFRAQLVSGETVAVKIKYPGIEGVIKSDLRLARFLRPLYEHFFFEGDVDDVLIEIEQRFTKETDYLNEAQAHQEFSDFFQNDAHIMIPKIYLPYCTPRILVTEYVDAPRVDQFLEMAPLSDREQLARRLLRFSMLTGLKFGLLQIDPHLGNMLVTPEKLVMLDFGASYRMPADLQVAFRKMMLAKYTGDGRIYYDVFVSLGYIDPQKVSYEMFREGPEPYLLTPFQFDERRPFFYPGQKSFLEFVHDHRWDRYFKPRRGDFFALIISQYLEDLLHSFRVELNWHRELGGLLEELGLLEERAEEREAKSN